MIRTRSEAFLATQRQLVCIHQVAEELPTCRNFVQVLSHRSRNPEHEKSLQVKSNTCRLSVSNLSRAALVGILRAKPLMPVCLKYLMQSALAAITARLSQGETKKPFLPRIMFRSWKVITECGKRCKILMERVARFAHAVAIKRSSNIVDAFLHFIDKIGCVREIRVRVTTSEVRQGCAVDGTALRHPKFLHENLCDVRADNCNKKSLNRI